MVKFKRFSKATTGLMLALVLVMVPQLAAAGEATVPQTSPPPMMVQPMVVFEGYSYLKSSTVSLSIGSNLTASVPASTYAKSTVSEVGGTIQLQEWSGSSWINLVPTVPYSSKNSISSSGAMTKSVRSGYYYRAKVTHFASHNGTTETAIEYSDTILAP